MNPNLDNLPADQVSRMTLDKIDEQVSLIAAVALAEAYRLGAEAAVPIISSVGIPMDETALEWARTIGRERTLMCLISHVTVDSERALKRINTNRKESQR